MLWNEYFIFYSKINKYIFQNINLYFELSKLESKTEIFKFMEVNVEIMKVQ